MNFSLLLHPKYNLNKCQSRMLTKCTLLKIKLFSCLCSKTYHIALNVICSQLWCTKVVQKSCLQLHSYLKGTTKNVERFYAIIRCGHPCYIYIIILFSIPFSFFGLHFFSLDKLNKTMQDTIARTCNFSLKLYIFFKIACACNLLVHPV